MSRSTHQLIFGLIATIALADAQSVSVQSLGARGDGVTDDTNAIQNAINMAPSGSTVDFGGSDKTYLVSQTILLQSNRNYSGSAKILLSNQAAAGSPILSLRDTQPNSVSITGLALDGNYTGNAFVVDFASNTTALIATNVTLQNLSIMNTVGQYAIYSPGTLDQSTITGNTFLNCSGGISVFSPDHLAITNNHFNNITLENAITVSYNAVAVEYGQSLTISGNDGQNLGRMAIEVIGDGQSKPGAIVVSQNSFNTWLQPSGWIAARYSVSRQDGRRPLRAVGNTLFGISIFTGTEAQIIDNVVEGSGQIGIEIGSPGAVVKDNLVSDFGYGMTVEAPNVTIQNNRLLHNAQFGISVTNSSYSKQSTIISGNYIAEAQLIGINISGSSWQGSQFTGNTIVRSPVWLDDASTTFTGIGITPPSGSVSIVGNSVVFEPAGTGSNPSFIGIRINGGAGSNADSRYDSNTIRSTLGPLGTGIYGGSPGSLDGVIITNNGFFNLANATDGSSTQNPVAGGNTYRQCAISGSINLFQ